ncbi:GNAT family N-acetyltransferase [Cellulosilyticum sp. ST5]|uniref:GNAT family N-acetyltransferase n=1 Tax=unclassified Cellulosilyticum TaxID=2643091 RepID=UPI000F8CBF23|nr:GNAT family N-acetyltransferase [Cellulosilyticum sp. WCF-2]QEH67117.1 GNAT family N-acetyltransferase [Cellulosilyticum sp. WCF-2]
MIKIINKEALDELSEVLGKGIYEGYTVERIQREAPDFHFYLKENHEVLACCSIWIHTNMIDEKGVRAGAIGHFEACNEDSAKIVLMEACNKLKEVGEAYVIGPIDGSTWNSYRLVTHSDGSMPFLMEPKYKPGYSQWLENVGFKPTYQYFSTKETIKSIVKDTKKDSQNEITESKLEQSEIESIELDQSINGNQELLEIKPIKLAQLEEALDKIYEISIQSFKSNLFYKPIEREAFKAMYRGYQQFLVEELVLIAEKAGRPVGFIFAVPNYFDQTRRSVIIKTIAVLPEYQQEGIGKKLYQEITNKALNLGFTEFITALIYKGNHSQKLCESAKMMREYTLFRKELKV